MDSPYSAENPNEPFDYQALWDEFKGTLLWMFILTNTSILSYCMGREEGLNQRRIQGGSWCQDEPETGNQWR